MSDVIDPFDRPNLDHLPWLPSLVSVHQFSSHNRQGINKDDEGFLYRDENGDNVIFDVLGPGCVRNIWAAAYMPGIRIKFYFNGETKPRYDLPLDDFFEGRHEAFRPPLTSRKKLGYYGDNPWDARFRERNDFDPRGSCCFVSIPFARSLKITLNRNCFHHVLFERHPFGVELPTFTGRENQSRMVDAYEKGGEAFVSGGEQSVTFENDCVAPGVALTLFESEKPGVIRRMVIECDGSEDFLRSAWLRMQWDGALHNQVNAPIGHFFAIPLRAEEVKALPIQSEPLGNGRVRLTCRFPMPFWKSAKIQLTSSRSSELWGPIRATFDVGAQAYPAQRAAHFHTHHREGFTEYGRDWLFYEGPGTGKFVGVVQTMHGEHYCEGDEHFFIDGACSPQINGTGSEDYYLCAFWPNVHNTGPFSGCVGDVWKQGGAHFEGSYRHPAAYYRFHLEAPIPFYNSVNLRIQHGPDSHIRSRYSSLAYLYMRREPVLRQTDWIDVGNETSEQMHNYQSTHSQIAKLENGRCEGEMLHYPLSDTGRHHRGGVISFRAAIDAQNGGVRLRRRIDQDNPRQCADVYINDEFAGIWYHPDGNPHLRWFDSDFDIHPKFTQGKTSLRIRLAVRENQGYGVFTDFHYAISCFEPQEKLQA